MDQSVPYSGLLGPADPLAVLGETPARIEELTRSWDGRRWAMSYAPSKWTAAQVVLHLAQDEIGWGHRVRMLLTLDDYVPQPFDGGAWVAVESPLPFAEALAAFAALRRFNLALYGRLSPEQKSRSCRHPEFGAISVDWITRVLAGHDLHHLGQLKAIGEA